MFRLEEKHTINTWERLALLAQSLRSDNYEDNMLQYLSLCDDYGFGIQKGLPKPTDCSQIGLETLLSKIYNQSCDPEYILSKFLKQMLILKKLGVREVVFEPMGIVGERPSLARTNFTYFNQDFMYKSFTDGFFQVRDYSDSLGYQASFINLRDASYYLRVKMEKGKDNLFWPVKAIAYLHDFNGVYPSYSEFISQEFPKLVEVEDGIYQQDYLRDVPSVIDDKKYELVLGKKSHLYFYKKL